MVLVQPHMALQAAFLHKRLLAHFALKPLVVLVYSNVLLESPRSGKGFGADIARVHLTAGVPGHVINQAAFREEFRVALVT